MRLILRGAVIHSTVFGRGVGLYDRSDVSLLSCLEARHGGLALSHRGALSWTSGDQRLLQLGLWYRKQGAVPA